jgi:hypothetical protein
MNTRRAPERVIAADCLDQVADLGRDQANMGTTPVSTKFEAEPLFGKLTGNYAIGLPARF